MSEENRETEHFCARDNDNIIFYSTLWKSWALKIIPPEKGKECVFVTISFCPYCGEHLSHQIETFGMVIGEEEEFICAVCKEVLDEQLERDLTLEVAYIAGYGDLVHNKCLPKYFEDLEKKKHV